MFNLFRKKSIFDDPELNGHIVAIRLILNHVVRSMPEEPRTELLETLKRSLESNGIPEPEEYDEVEGQAFLISMKSVFTGLIESVEGWDESNQPG